MNKLAISFLLLFFSIAIAVETADDSSHPNDYKIAKAVRQAVRDANPDLLNSTILGVWRDHLKLAAMELDVQTQPLILIKFDEDINFRNQLKKIIEWEVTLEKKETSHYVYYFDKENSIPEVILGAQDAYFDEITRLFSIEIEEKLPYRYELEAEQGYFYPLDDLRGGIVSPDPLDLEKTAGTIFSFVNSGLPCITHPLARIYGGNFGNPATSKAYYDTCLEEIKLHGYFSMADLFENGSEVAVGTQEWFSAYAFVYLLNQTYEPRQLTHFLEMVNSEMTSSEFVNAFEEVFGKTLADLELNNQFQQHAKKL